MPNLALGELIMERTFYFRARAFTLWLVIMITPVLFSCSTIADKLWFRARECNPSRTAVGQRRSELTNAFTIVCHLTAGSRSLPSIPTDLYIFGGAPVILVRAESAQPLVGDLAVND